MNAHEKSRVIVLDLDNTLYDYQPCHTTGLNKLVAFLGQELRIDGKALETEYIKSSKEVKKRLGTVASSHSRLLYVQEMYRRLNLRLETRVILQAEQTYWSEFLGTMQLVEGTIDFLANARRRGFKIVLVTDLTSQIQLRKIQRLGVETWIDALFTSEELGSDKADPAVFSIVHSLAGIEPGSEVWFIGDDEKDLPSEARLQEIGINVVSRRFHRSNGKSAFGEAFYDFKELLQITRWI
jgi:putative hydrolase of the HAD superfamily